MRKILTIQTAGHTNTYSLEFDPRMVIRSNVRSHEL